ncbi:DUF2182 domain-containing protein, partial [Hydrogenophaga sp.]|uniref:copper chaperone n=1 Tax=Hydrogenophaga sp. TaxID=1904254 RepID=UPI00356548A1
MHTALRWKWVAASRHAPVWIGMVAIAALCWFYLVRMDQSMSAMGGAHAAQKSMAMNGDGLGQLGAAFAMWAVMMLAMMLPTVVPSALLFSNLAAKRKASNSNMATAMYVAGYSASWILFAAPAAALQATLTATSLLDPMAQSTSAL